ncbi:hypothetical protein Csa_011868 [Cucumis sativus]|uniref:Uncharacterized protein n=1 Tax=Cucumis sativus TaxID=3659 RepID=A0A0A0K3I0_CUCSA|nr:hypothetical protein Csa_011868 [Cucumis sativus]
MSPSQSALDPPISNLDPDHIESNVLVITNITEEEVLCQTTIEDKILNEEGSAEKQEKSDKDEAQREHVELEIPDLIDSGFRDVLHNVIVVPMNVAF